MMGLHCTTCTCVAEVEKWVPLSGKRENRNTQHYEVECPKCGAPPRHRCAALSSGKPTTIHPERYTK